MFKLNQKKYLLTYPQCTLTKEEVLKTLHDRCPIKCYTISREQHSDGGLHIHAVVVFERKIHTTSNRVFDISGFHPNIEPLKTLADKERATKYVKKDGDFITNDEKMDSKRLVLAKRVIDHGKIDAELIRENPELIFVNHSSITAWLAYLRPKTSTIVYPTDKKRHYWIYGPSNSGKTTQLRKYLEGKNSSEIPDNNDYRCDDETQVLYADEYRGHLTVQHLNKLCDGNVQLNRKGGSTHIMFPIVFIVSNFSVRDCYHNISDAMIDTLLNRFNEFDISSTILNL